jgi:Rab proteins geranylgeranyltransferase component A
LQEADEWAGSVGAYHDGSGAQLTEAATSQAFQNAQISRLPEKDGEPKLSFSRAYSLALGPQLIYTESIFLKYLVTSKVYRQLDFLALGSWWLLTSAEPREGETPQKLVRIPSSREELAFSDDFVDIRSKRSVMKVLRFIADYEEQADVWEPFRSRPFADFLREHFILQPATVDLFLALVLSTSDAISTEYALPRIARHLRSIGRLGPGFSSVIPKWGGLSEVAQVACRAGAVGGFVYVLGRDIETVQTQNGDQEWPFELALAQNDVVRTKKIVGSLDDLPKGSSADKRAPAASRSICVVSSPLTPLFPTLTEGAPPPAGSMVILPAGSLNNQGTPNKGAIYLVVHSADTGECPQGQSKSGRLARRSNDESTIEYLSTFPDRH